MKPWFRAILIFTILLTSACSAQATTEAVTAVSTATQAPTHTETQAPTPTETPSVEASATVTPETPIPTNAPNCTNKASFVADVTIPDNSDVPAGTTFTKTWRVRNSGTCIWSPGYTLAHYSDERMGAPDSIPLTLTFPDQTVDVSVDLVASTAVGTHRGNFVIRNPEGLIMSIDDDSRLWVIISVSAAPASETPTAAATGIPVTGTTTEAITGTAAATQVGQGKAACAFTGDQTRVADVIRAVNAYRAQNELPAYTVNEQLTQAATRHANDMACNGLFFHKGSDGSSPATRVVATGYTAAAVTENVYGSYPPLSGQGAVDWWKNDKTDPNHNKNLLSSTYTEIGVAYSFYNNYGYYVLVFAAPQ